MLVSNFEVAWLDSAEGRRDETPGLSTSGGPIACER